MPAKKKRGRPPVKKPPPPAAKEEKEPEDEPESANTFEETTPPIEVEITPASAPRKEPEPEPEPEVNPHVLPPAPEVFPAAPPAVNSDPVPRKCPNCGGTGFLAPHEGWFPPEPMGAPDKGDYDPERSAWFEMFAPDRFKALDDHRLDKEGIAVWKLRFQEAVNAHKGNN